VKVHTQIALLGLWLSVGVMVGSILAGQWFPVGELQRTRLFGFALAGMLVLLFSVEHLNLWKHPTFQAGALHIILPVIALLIGTGIAAGFFLIPLNAALQAEPQTINTEPYGGGWLFRLKPARPDALQALLTADAYDRGPGA
jgi:LPLT family lysophospholipid transporter-like MFS transporter